MNVAEAIASRRSVKVYDPDQRMSEAEIEKLMGSPCFPPPPSISRTGASCW